MRTQPVYDEWEETEEESGRPGISGGTVAALAVGAAAVTAGIIYLFTGERGEHNRERLRAWMEKARRMETSKKFERAMDAVLGEDDEASFDRIR